MYDLANFQAPQANFQTPGIANPYEQALREQQRLQMEELQRQKQQEEQQQQQTISNYNDIAQKFMQGSGQGTAASTVGATPGMSSSAAVNAAGGSLQSSMAAPLAQSSALGSGGLGGGSVVGPMSAAPTAGMSTAGTTAGTLGSAGTGGAAGTMGGGAAGASGGGAAAGGGALAAAAPWLAIPAAVGVVGHMENNAGVNTWGQQIRDPGGSASRRADFIGDKAQDWLGDNKFGEGVGDVMGGLNKVVMPGSFGDWWDGTKKIHGWDKIGGELSNLGSSIGDLFSGWF